MASFCFAHLIYDHGPDAELDSKLNMRTHEEVEEVAPVSGMGEDDQASRDRGSTSTSERRKWWRVYAMHFLFMWNIRTYEYVSVGDGLGSNLCLKTHSCV